MQEFFYDQLCGTLTKPPSLFTSDSLDSRKLSGLKVQILNLKPDLAPTANKRAYLESFRPPNTKASTLPDVSSQAAKQPLVLVFPCLCFL